MDAPQALGAGVKSKIDLPVEIQQFIYRSARRRRWIRLLWMLGSACLFLVLWIVVSGILAETFQLPPGKQRWLVAFGLFGVIGILFAPVLAILRGRVRWLRESKRIEASTPVFEQRLITVVTQAQLPVNQQGSPELQAAVQLQTIDLAAACDVSNLYPIRLAIKPWLTVFALTAVLIALSQCGIEKPVDGVVKLMQACTRST